MTIARQSDSPIAGITRSASAQLPSGIWAPLVRDGVRHLFLATDVVACLAAAILTHVPLALAGLLTISVLGLFAGEGLYRSRLALSVLDDLPRLLRRWIIATAVLVICSQLILGELAGVRLAVVAGLTVLVIGR